MEHEIRKSQNPLFCLEVAMLLSGCDRPCAAVYHPRWGGGMLLLVKNDIRQGVKISNTEDPDILGITLRKEFFNLPEDTLIWFAYASPVNSPYTKGRESVMAKLETLIASQPGDHHIIMGDLNGRTSTDADHLNEKYEAHSPM